MTNATKLIAGLIAVTTIEYGGTFLLGIVPLGNSNQIDKLGVVAH